eukprot:EG_transcript_24212
MPPEMEPAPVGRPSAQDLIGPSPFAVVRSWLDTPPPPSSEPPTHLPKTPDGVDIVRRVETLARIAWPEVRASLGQRQKLVIFLRHAQGVHNVADAIFGEDNANDWIFEGHTWKEEGDLFDSELSDKGKEQVKALNRALRATGLLQIICPDFNDLCVLSSPLVRTLDTVLGGLKGIPGVGPVTVVELCREVLHRSPEAFPNLHGRCTDVR